MGPPRFGWKLHDVVGAQIVSVPAKLSDRAADAALQRLSGGSPPFLEFSFFW
jgi:hypothetical protein